MVTEYRVQDIVRFSNKLPGTSGTLTPFAEMESLYFNNDNETDDWFYQFTKKMDEISDKENITHIKFEFDNEKDFYDALEKMRSYYDDCQIFGTSREGKCEIVVENEISDDDKNNASE